MSPVMDSKKNLRRAMVLFVPRASDHNPEPSQTNFRSCTFTTTESPKASIFGFVNSWAVPSCGFIGCPRHFPKQRVTNPKCPHPNCCQSQCNWAQMCHFHETLCLCSKIIFFNLQKSTTRCACHEKCFSSLS